MKRMALRISDESLLTGPLVGNFESVLVIKNTGCEQEVLMGKCSVVDETNSQPGRHHAEILLEVLELTGEESLTIHHEAGCGIFRDSWCDCSCIVEGSDGSLHRWTDYSKQLGQS